MFMSEVHLSGWENLGKSFNCVDISQILVYSWQGPKQQRNYPKLGAAAGADKSFVWELTLGIYVVLKAGTI